MPLLRNSRALWSARMLFVLAYCAVLSAPLVTAKFTGPGAGGRDLLPGIGNNLVLFAFPILALQPVLAARFNLLDRAFGLDIVYVFHKTMGMTACAVLACAPFFLFAGSGNRTAPSDHGHSWQIFAGTSGLVLLLVLVMTALLYRELRMRYEGWRSLHNVLALAVLLLVFVYGMSLGEVTGAWPVTVIWVLLFVSAAAAYVYHKFVGPSLRGKRPFRVESIIRETHNVWTITLAPPEGRERFEYLPGQFQFLTFLRGSRLRGEEHPFTISSSPGRKGFHASTIKESGDFTRTIGETRAGDLVAVQAPFGRFSYLLHPGERDLVFIAGGVGITPLMSMLRHMRDMDADKEVLVLYANSTEQDILFRDELDRIASAERPRLSVVHVLSKAAPEWRGERGHIDQAVIRKYCRGDLEGKSFYLCGPPAMMTALIAAVIDLGVPSRRVRSERFAL